MQNGAHNDHALHSLHASGRLVGFVRLLIGGHMHDLPVQAVSIDKDGDKNVGGFFAHDGQLGILVDDDVPPPVVQAQIEAATLDAVRHLSRRYLN